MASLSSSSTTNTRVSLPPYWSSEINTSSLREASFSSYLNPSEEAYIRSLVESTQNHLVSKEHDHHLHKSRQKKKKKAEDGEIDVFTADKYFSSGVIDQESDKFSTSGRFQQQQHRHDVEDRTDDDQQQVVRVNSNNKLKVVQSRASSSQSEVSSNSQSALLRRRLHRTPSRTTNERKTHQQQGKTMSLLACSCCVGKSVDTDQEFTDHGSRGRGRGRISDGVGRQTRSIKTSLDTAEIARMNKLRLDNNIDPFVFPLSNSASLTAINKVQLVDVDEDEARKSLEVFGSDLDEGSKRFSLQKRLNMLSWDAIPRGTTEDQISTTSDAPSETYKDTESDASSDLFEIECLSCTSNPLNHTPTTTRYAPSEASIEWSVVTASAADFSVVSDSEDHRSRKVQSKSTKRSMNKEVQKQGSGVFLGCKSQKAVNVAKEVHRKSPVRGKSESQRMNRLSDSFNPVTRFQAEAKLPGFGYRQRHSFTSDLLYIQ